MQDDRKEIFDSIRIQYNREYWKTVIVWGNPIKIKVIANNDLVQRQTVVEKVWKVADKELKQMQDLLNEAIAEKHKNGSECVLDLKTQSSLPIQIAFDEKNTTKILKNVREKFETFSHLHYTEALFVISLAEELQENNMLEESIRFYRIGIETLGERYKSEEIIDDTGAKLIFAEHSHKRGNIEQSAELFKRVLEARLQVYQDKVGK